MVIIGITGLNGSGKSELAKYLEKKGFFYISANKLFSKEAIKRGFTTDREDLIKVGKLVREELGKNAFVIKAKELFKDEFNNRDVVIESLRNPGEIEELEKEENFYLIGVKANIKLRYERAKIRKRDKDIESFEKFKETEKRELESDNENSQQLLKCYEKINYEIINEGSFNEFYEKIDVILDTIKKIKTPFERFENSYFTIYNFGNKIIKRPFKDKYYLDIAKVVSSRSTCLSVRFGALILKDDQIVSTGYVGAPRNVLSSLDRGFCLRRKLNIPHGQRYEICRSVHAEQNAIINAARSGVSLLGSKIYFWGARYLDNEGLELINGFPCFICKKMIINSGIKKFISHDKKGRIKIYDVDKWIKNWSEKDMLEDLEIYK